MPLVTIGRERRWCGLIIGTFAEGPHRPHRIALTALSGGGAGVGIGGDGGAFCAFVCFRVFPESRPHSTQDATRPDTSRQGEMC